MLLAGWKYELVYHHYAPKTESFSLAIVKVGDGETWLIRFEKQAIQEKWVGASNSAKIEMIEERVLISDKLATSVCLAFEQMLGTARKLVYASNTAECYYISLPKRDGGVVSAIALGPPIDKGVKQAKSLAFKLVIRGF